MSLKRRREHEKFSIHLFQDMKTGASDDAQAEKFFAEGGVSNFTELQEYAKIFTPTAENVKLLADACRKPEWRAPLRDAGLLTQVLNLVSLVDPRLTVQILRFIGNCCAYEDQSRKLALSSLADIAWMLAIPTLGHYAQGALHNILLDYEPALAAAVAQRVHEYIAEALPLLEYVSSADIEDLICIIDYIEEHALHKQLTPLFLRRLIGLPTILKLDDEAYHGVSLPLLDTLLSLLRNSTVQQLIIESGIVNNLVLLYRAWVSDVAAGPAASRDALVSGADTADAEEFKSHRNKAVELSGAICDVATAWKFQNIGEMRDSTDFLEIMRLVRNGDDKPSQYMACLVLGNLARQDRVARDMVSYFRVDSNCVSIILNMLNSNASSNGESSDELIHAAGSLLRNLAVPEDDGKPLLESGAFHAACQILKRYAKKHENAQSNVSRFSDELLLLSLRILRQLAQNSEQACRLLVDHRVCQPTNTKMSVQVVSVDDVAHLLARSQDNTTITPQVKVEIARIIVALYRTLNKPPDHESAVASNNHRFLDILSNEPIWAESLFYLVNSGAGTSLAVEGWFGLALMAKASDVGASNVLEVLRKDWGVLNRVQNECTDGIREDPKNLARENARFLAQELWKRLTRPGSGLSGSDAQHLRDFIKNGQS